MANANHMTLLKAGRPALDKFIAANPEVILDLSGENLSRCDLNGLKVVGVNCEKAMLEQVVLENAAIPHSQFDLADLRHARMNNADISGASFVAANLQSASLVRAVAPGAVFSGANLTSGMCVEGNFENANFQAATLRGAKLQSGRLKGADLRGADLGGADLQLADLSGADLRAANLYGANFSGSRVKGARIRRVDVEDLRANQLAGLRPSQLHEMAIEDGFGELRNAFSGFWTFVHLISIAFWLTPLLWIAGRSLLLSIAPAGVEGRLYQLSLWEQGWGYIKSGAISPVAKDGILSYPVNWWFALTWGIVLIYNVSRFVFLARVKVLEHKQSITGLHPEVTLQGNWLQAFRVVNVLFYFNVALSALHFIKFLNASFPVIALS